MSPSDRDGWLLDAGVDDPAERSGIAVELSEALLSFGALLERVAHGETFSLRRDGVELARLTPPSTSPTPMGELPASALDGDSQPDEGLDLLPELSGRG